MINNFKKSNIQIHWICKFLFGNRKFGSKCYFFKLSNVKFDERLKHVDVYRIGIFIFIFLVLKYNFT